MAANDNTAPIVSSQPLSPFPFQANPLGPDGKFSREVIRWMTQVEQRLGGGWNDNIAGAQVAAEMAALNADQTPLIEEMVDQLRTERETEIVPYQAAIDIAQTQLEGEIALNYTDVQGQIDDLEQRLRTEIELNNNFGLVQAEIEAGLATVVQSFNGRTGAVVPVEADYTLNLLGDVAISSPAANQVVSYNGSTWVNSAVPAGGISGTVAVANGGTGQTSLTANNVILGNGTSPVSFVAPGTSGNVLTSNGTTWQSTAPTVAGTAVVSQSSNYTESTTAGFKLARVDATSAAVTGTLPTAASSTGFTYTIKKIDSSVNTVTLKGNGAETIDGSNTQVISAQYDAITVVSNGTSWDII